MMPGSAYCVSPPIAPLSPAVNGEGYTSPHGIANFRENRPEGPGHRDGDVAELRRARSGRGPAGDRRDSRARRHLRRHLADVWLGRARAGQDAGRAPARRDRGDQGLGRLGARGPRADSPRARVVRRRDRPLPDPQPRGVGDAPAVSRRAEGAGQGSCDRHHALECVAFRADGDDHRGRTHRGDPDPYNPRECEVEAELLPLAERRGLGVVLMRPLEKGALTRTAPPARELGFLADYGIRTWAQALLNWGVSDPRVSVSIPATGDVKHAIDNCEVGNARRFDAAARDRVAALARRHTT